MATVNTYRDFSFASQERFPVISNIEFLLEPQVLKTLFNVNPLQTDIGDFMKMGLMEKVEGEEIMHREERKIIDAPFLNTSVTVTDVFGTASVGNGDPSDFSGLNYVQLAASAHTPTTGDLTNTMSYPRVGDIIEFNGQYFWRIQGKRETVANAHRLYITKMIAADPGLSAIITNVGGSIGGDQITVPGNLYEEASWGTQQGLISPFKVYRSYLGISGDVYQTTDKQIGNRTYPIIDPGTGNTINFYWVLGSARTEVRWMTKRAMTLFAIPQADASAVAYDPVSATNKTLSNSAGYIPTLEANAAKKQYDDNVTLGIFKDVARLRNRLNQAGDAMWWHGPEFGYRVSDLITQIGDDGSIVYDRKAVDLDISVIKIPGARSNLKSLRILDNPQLTNIPGRKYPWYFIVKPMDKVEEPKTGIPMDCVTIMFKQQEGGGARGTYKIWQTGAMAPVPTSEQRVCNTNYAASEGIRIVAAAQHVLGNSAQF